MCMDIFKINYIILLIVNYFQCYGYLLSEHVTVNLTEYHVSFEIYINDQYFVCLEFESSIMTITR